MSLLPKISVGLTLVFFLFGCLNNSTQVWVSDLDTNIRDRKFRNFWSKTYQIKKIGHKIFSWIKKHF